MLESLYDVEGTGHLKSDSSVIGDSKVADIIFVSLTALKYHYVMLLFTSPDNINIWNMNKFSMFFICYECMVSFYLLAGIFYPLQKKKNQHNIGSLKLLLLDSHKYVCSQLHQKKKIEKWKNGNGTVSSTPHRNSDWIQQKKSFITRKKVVIRGKQSANWSRDLFDWQPSE